MENNKLLSMIGLCKKAGRLLQGKDRVVEAVWNGKVRLILVAEDISPNNLKSIEYVSEETGIACQVIPVTIQELGERTGKHAGILGITDSGFAKAIQKIIVA